MKTIYTIGWNSKPRKGEIPFGFKNRALADRLAVFIARLFRVETWMIINNRYSDAEIAEIKHAYQEAQQHPLDQDDLKVWHWKP